MSTAIRIVLGATLVIAVMVGAMVAIFVSGTARAQANRPINVFPSYVTFDWPWVESCARAGDERCRIAVAARGSCR